MPVFPQPAGRRGRWFRRVEPHEQRRLGGQLERRGKVNRRRRCFAAGHQGLWIVSRSNATVRRRFRIAKAWLYRRLSGREPVDGG